MEFRSVCCCNSSLSLILPWLLNEGMMLSYYMFQSLPRLRFNKEGNLLAVTTADNGFKILVNAAGVKSFKAIESTAYFEGLRPAVESTAIKVPIIYLGFSL